MADVAASDWLDPRFAPLDTRTAGESLMESLTRIAGEQTPPESPAEPAVEPAPEPVAAPPAEPAPAPEPQGPKVIQNPDGSTVTIEKSSRGWKATLSSGGAGQPEVFYGATKEDMWANIAGSKLHATKKIRELNRKLKLGEDAPAPAPKPAAATSSLTAEERAMLAAKFAADPVDAMDEFFRRRFGRSPEELAQAAERGVIAQRALVVDEASRAFLAQNPGYYNHDANYVLLVGLLAKQKLRKQLTEANRDEILNALVDGGHFTAAALTDAYEELNDEGLLHVAPVPTPAPQPTPAPVPPPPAPEPPVTAPPAPPAPREERRLRAGFGLPPSAASAATPEPAKPLSDQELANMTDAEIASLWAATRQAARARRS